MKIINGKLLFHTLILTAVTGLTGCSVWTDAHSQKQEMMACYMRGENDAVQQKITEELEYTSDSGDELMWQLEAGSFYFHIGNYQQSIGHFTRAEKLIEDYGRRNIPHHYGDENLMSRHAKVENGLMKVGKCSYKYVVMPWIQTIDKSTYALLKEFLKQKV